MNDAARRTLFGAPLSFLLMLLGAILLAAVYLARPWLALPFWIAVGTKGGVCLVLAFALWRLRGGDGDARRVGLALLLSAVGDVLLAVDPVSLFVFGLGSFLLAHLVYLWQFLRHRPRPLHVPVSRGLVIGGLLAAVAAMLVALGPGLGGLAGPVYAYIAAITAMALSAALLPGRGLVLLGALFFMLSDSLIALNKFVAPVPLAGPAIWATYVAAQVLIVLGWRNGRRIA